MAKHNFSYKVLILSLLVLGLTSILTSCFNEKNSPIYDSEWIMEGFDQEGQPYLNQIFFKPDHTATFQTYYLGSTLAYVWTGTYKLTDKKITFDFTKCEYTKQDVGSVPVDIKNIVKYFSGDFYYAVAEIEEDGKSVWKMDLTRPKNLFYGKNLDVFGMPLDTFVRQ